MFDLSGGHSGSPQREERGTLDPHWVGRSMVRHHSLEMIAELKCETILF